MAGDGGLNALRVSDGAFLRYVDLPGDEPAIVWIHGWQCSSTGELLPVATQPSLAGRRSVLVDLLGHGYSDKPHDFAYTMVDHARTVVELLDVLALQNCALVGHSMGGAIAIRVAAERPGVVTNLIMAEGNLDPDGEEVLDGQSEQEFVEKGFEELVASMRAQAQADPSGIAAVHLGMTELLEPRAVHRAAVSMSAGHHPSASSLLSSLSCGRWYLEGELSDPDPDFDKLIVELGATILRIARTGHAMGLENPRGLADTIAAVLGNAARPN